MMPRPLHRFVLFALLLAGTASCGSKHDYTVEEYRAIFAISPSTADVGVTLDILYAVGATPKSDGFKFVGSAAVANLVAHDDRGVPLRSEVVQLRETKIAWYFDPIANARKRVIVSFTLPGYLQRDGDTITLDAPWTGTFRVPVRHARYELIFPPRTQPKIQAAKPDGGIESAQGALVFIARQAPIDTERFTVSFSLQQASTVDRRASAQTPYSARQSTLPHKSRSNQSSAKERSTMDTLDKYSPLIFGVGVAIILFFAIFITERNKRKGKDGSSGGGCSSTSSCSGGGCSSCGGGCGGGCGG